MAAQVVARCILVSVDPVVRGQACRADRNEAMQVSNAKVAEWVVALAITAAGVHRTPCGEVSIVGKAVRNVVLVCTEVMANVGRKVVRETDAPEVMVRAANVRPAIVPAPAIDPKVVRWVSDVVPVAGPAQVQASILLIW